MAINPEYMQVENLLYIKKSYSSNNNIMLNNIFQDKIFNLLSNKVSNSIFSSKFDPDKYRYSITTSKQLDSFFYGNYFELLVKNILGFKKFNVVYEIRKFESGDFTLLHDSESSSKGIDFILDLSSSSERNGGFVNYVFNDEVLNIITKSNSLSFINKNKSLYYVKYVNHKQRDPIILVFGNIIKS